MEQPIISLLVQFGFWLIVKFIVLNMSKLQAKGESGVGWQMTGWIRLEVTVVREAKKWSIKMCIASASVHLNVMEESVCCVTVPYSSVGYAKF